MKRRQFLKTAGAAGVYSALATVEHLCAGAQQDADTNDPNADAPVKVPRRRLGKTGFDVPCLALGADFGFVDKQVVLRKCLDFGVDYWDSSYGYAGGNSELGIGRFLKASPKLRKDIFLVSKAQGAETVAAVEKCLQESLKRAGTDYFDLYCVHSVEDPAELADDLKRWVQDAKSRQLIRYFGFSTHKNMAKCLSAAAQVGWVDVVMTLYNFRFLRDSAMNAAVDECHKAGVGLLAMKTQALLSDEVWMEKPQGDQPDEHKRLVEHFRQKGFTDGQAKIKVVMQDERFSSVCVGMDTVATLKLNVAAALDKTQLTKGDRDVLSRYAQATCTGYCAGCAEICGSVMPDGTYVSDIMRQLMYYHGYGDVEKARRGFAAIPQPVQNRLLVADYSAAETLCPNHLPISRLVAQAAAKLARRGGTT